MDKFSILMIDPPWPKKKGGKRKVCPNQGRELDYQTLSLEDIATLLDNDILTMAESQHTVFIWTVDEFLIPCEHMMLERGYRRHARLIWDKKNGVAPAFSVRYSHEYLLWMYKPKFTPIDKDYRGKFTTVFTEPPREHSRKPDIAYDMIDKMFSGADKIDVFSREKRPGWAQWGDQTNHFGGKI